ncbi:hypothetical protein P9112_011016 [Eukaryota sp. TZLM1-RC]
MNFYRLVLWSIFLTYVYLVLSAVILNRLHASSSPPEISFSLGTCNSHDLVDYTNPLNKKIGYWRDFTLLLYPMFDHHSKFTISLRITEEGMKINYAGAKKLVQWQYAVQVSNISQSTDLFNQECVSHGVFTVVPFVTVCRPLVGDNRICLFFGTDRLPSSFFLKNQFSALDYDEPKETNHFPYTQTLISAILFLVITGSAIDPHMSKLDISELNFSSALLAIIALIVFTFCIIHLHHTLFILLHFYSPHWS